MTGLSHNKLKASYSKVYIFKVPVIADQIEHSNAFGKSH